MRERVVVPHATLSVTIERCGPEDLEPMLDRLETLLHEDYFFRRKHFAAILARPQAAVYAVRVEGDFAAIAIVYNGSTLQNLYVHPEHKSQGVGTAVLAHLNPEVVRAKGNMSQGDPVGFYQQAGYKATGAAEGKPHIVLMEKQTGPPPSPTATQPPTTVATPAGCSPSRIEQLNKARERSIAKRKKIKADADYTRLVRAGIDHAAAHRAAYGEGSDAVPPAVEIAALPAAPAVGTLPD
jgi:GNAT superfamily N-acetyltransferase